MPTTSFALAEKYHYQCGFDSHLESEAVPSALPVGQNSPQRPSYGLYAEKLSGTAFTAPRCLSKQTWLYRILPSCSHGQFAPIEPTAAAAEDRRIHYLPNQLRWNPFEHDAAGAHDFVSGMHLVAGAGDPALKQGLAIFTYMAGRSMAPRDVFTSADGDLLVVPQDGALDIRTELGRLLVRPMEICLLPRGVRYHVALAEPHRPARGYALELYQGHFALPELGPIGSNGLANARDFQAPVADFIDDDHPLNTPRTPPDMPNQATAAATYRVVLKFNGALFAAQQRRSPFDVVAWHGNYYPVKYDLGRFNTIGTVSYDHPDPSIYTVLTAPSATAGTAVADFVVFPPRWLVAEHTFRPPWFHRNTMAEFMGLIGGAYDARRDGPNGFAPGGASLHNVMSAHGPDAAAVAAARGPDTDSDTAAAAALRPVRVGDGSCAFMFETSLMLGVSHWGLLTCNKVQGRYAEETWGDLPVHWHPPQPHLPPPAVDPLPLHLSRTLSSTAGTAADPA